MDSLVSIIMPTYNSEKSVKRAIESLLDQTYKDIEVIVVDDCSKDKTESIVNSFAGADERVKLFKNKDKGVSSARNTGINNASGKYLMFLDSDDEYRIDTVEIMCNLIEQNDTDLVVCNYETITEKGIELNKVNNTTGPIDKKNYLIDDIFNKHSLYYGAIWNKIFKLNIIKDNSISFNESLALGEDTVFDCEYLKYVGRLYISDESLYKYYVNNESSLTRQKDEVKKWIYMKGMYSYYVELLKDMNLLEEYKEQISYIVLSNMAIAIDSLNNISDKKEYEKQLREITGGEVVEFVLNNGKLSFTEKIIKYFLKNKKYKQMRMALQLKNRF